MVADRSMSTCKSSSSESKMFPPGFRFHPTDEELVLYYLKRKICRRRLKPDIIAETDVYKWDPDELPGQSKLKTGDRQWFFLSPRDRRYPNGSRSHRATMRGYWKATGKDRTISCNSRSVGLKKTLVYYKGRAPSCERTDWVMHEYTLDEEEMRRCPSAQDYYALYKVFKKSGPGPKNGEHYGAPFKEEEWADDECVNFSGFLDEENNVKEGNISCSDNNIAKRVQPDQVNDIEEFLKNLADDPVSIPPLSVNDYSYTFDQLITEKEIGSAIVNHFPVKVNLPDQSMVPQRSQRSDLLANPENTQSPPSQLQLEGAGVTFPVGNSEKGLNEILFEEFLEMDDLLGPEPFTQNFETEIQLSNGLGEVNLFNDVAMFMRDMGQGLNNPEMGMSDVGSHPCLNNAENRALTYQAEALTNEANMMSSQFQAPDQRCNILTPESNQAAISQQISGVICNGEHASLPTGTSQNQNCVEDDGTDSWFTSALWSFVEAIPTTPASASENALVNKAFEQMSSVSRLTTTPTTCRKLKKFIGGMFSFSILGIFCAMLWMLIGTSVKSPGTYVSS